ncbi:MAG TPA: hypothetical protein VN420_03530 [Candidatus Fimivivens sp.]|nr:hypothetical protein [Candidatus Fimivivens sp.]
MPTSFSLTTRYFLVAFLAVFAFLSFPFLGTSKNALNHPFVKTVFGESDDEEDEEDDDEEDDDGGSGSSKVVTTYVTQYVTKQVPTTVTVTPSEYLTDTDGDGLVDAIDPDPTHREQEYFTDSDGDSVPDIFDRHHGEDDFAYVESGTDADENGIIDAYEYTQNR